MVYKITYKKSVSKDLNRLSRLESSRILNQIEEHLANRALEFPELKGEFKRLRKFRVGKYRVIYTVVGEEVIILKIGHRKEVYR